LGKTVTAAGSTLTITDASPAGFSYEITGPESPFLVVRALNADGQYLSYSGGMSSDRMFAAGRSVSAQYYGEVAQLEVVKVLEAQQLQFPFELASVLPRLDGEAFPRPSRVDATLSAQAFDETFGDQASPELGPDQQTWMTPDAVVASGPFELEFSNLQAGGLWGLFANVTLRGPLMDALNQNLNAAVIHIDRIATPQGSEPIDHAIPVKLSRPGGYYLNGEYQPDPARAYLEGQASLQVSVEAESVSAIEGEVRIHLPTAVARLTSSPLRLGASADGDGLSIRLIKIGRDSLGFAVEGDVSRLIAIELMDEQEQMIANDQQSWLDGDVRNQVAVGYSGRPHRAEFIVASSSETRAFPFVVTLDEQP
jgi:hypothetical protein